MVEDGPKRSRMGKRPEKSAVHEREKAGSIIQDVEDEFIKSSEPYVCTGNFHLDFRRLCARNQMTEIPEVKPRPHRPASPLPVSLVEEKAKTGGKVGKDKGQPHPLPEPDPEILLTNEINEVSEPPPKTFTTKDRFEYFKPCVQVETEHIDKQDFVTEVYIRGWKIDMAMMNTLSQCLASLLKLQSISLWNAGLDSDTLEMLGSITCSSPNLKSLILDNNPVKSEAWQLLITENSSVQHLSLRYCNITDLGAKNLGEALGTTSKQNQKLISLYLTGNKITDVGAEHLSDGLRMNRTLLSLCLGSNLIGDIGATKLSEVISLFPLKHEEIVKRRTLLSSHVDRKIVTPLLSSRKGDSHDRPGSVRSQFSGQAGSSKGKVSKTPKKSELRIGKDEDSKHDKSKAGKTKEAEKLTKKATGTVETAKTTNKKADGKKRKTFASVEPEASDGTESHSPLLENVEHIGNGVLLLQGNFTLININLSNNKIGERGISAILKALQYQSTMIQFQAAKTAVEESMTVSSKAAKEKETSTTPVASRFITKGLLRLCLQRNNVPADNEDLKLIYTLMSTKDPLLKINDLTADQK